MDNRNKEGTTSVDDFLAHAQENGLLSEKELHAMVEKAAVEKKVLDELVDRFLPWKLPETFSPDCGVSFVPVNHPNSWPVGTNLFTATEARAMLAHVAAPLISRLSEEQRERELQSSIAADLLGQLNEAKLSLAEATSWTDEDRPLPEDARIASAHPLKTNDHTTYQEALRLVGAKRSKYALVDLVNWLLVSVKDAGRGAPEQSSMGLERFVIERRSDTGLFVIVRLDDGLYWRGPATAEAFGNEWEPFHPKRTYQTGAHCDLMGDLRSIKARAEKLPSQQKRFIEAARAVVKGWHSNMTVIEDFEPLVRELAEVMNEQLPRSVTAETAVLSQDLAQEPKHGS